MTIDDKGIDEKIGRLERNSGVAIWRQIADEIRGDIMAGKLQSGARMPAEMELATRFGVNRHTVRSAIAALTQEGVLRAEQGRGTFVANAKRLTYQIGRRTRISQALALQVGEMKGILLGSHMEKAPAEVALALAIDPGSEALRLETMHSADGNPISIATHWVDPAAFPSFKEDYAASGSITSAFKAAGVGDYLRKSTVISARHADPYDLKHLKLSPGAIVLTARAVNIDTSGKPIQYSLTRFSADRMEFVIENDSME
ncbi:phosphonate metabolism transcriptional regulator PhnF [Ochrobactrum daejeonense]|nr:phosphonate metabolism transcriptional regulator PhnF [Brucella daejeonensis]